MSQPAVEISALSFSYKGQNSPFLDQITLKVPQGSRFGIFGPNGAGKTTLMHLMTGLLHYEFGHVILMGHEMRNHNKSVNRLFGFVPQDFSFYEELSPRENLEFFGAWAGLDREFIRKRIRELLELLGLEDVKNKLVRTFSGGMKRRVNLAIGVLHQPSILFLDEPTVGVDVQSRNAIIDYLKELNMAGTTLVYTSHQLNEAEDLCKEIVLIDNGKIIAQDDLRHLLQLHSQRGLEGLFLELTGRAYRD